MDELQLNVQLREKTGTQTVKQVRRDDFIPAVVYGLDKPPTSIKVSRGEYEGLMRKHKGESVVFHINVLEGEKKVRDYSAIVKEEQLHPLRENILHIDFLRVSLTEEIEVSIQIDLKGDPIGVKQEGGSLDHVLRDLNVFCTPLNIPKALVVDISGLKIGDAIHVKDIKLPENVKTEQDPEAMVASVVPPMREEGDSEEEDQEPEIVGAKGDKESGDTESAGDASGDKEE